MLIKLPGKRFVALTAPANIPMGSQLDTRKGRVTLASAADTAGKKTQSADFHDGIFQIKQTVPGKKPKKPAALITDLLMKGQVARSQCAPLKGAGSAVAHKKKGPKAVLGQLWGSGKGSSARVARRARRRSAARSGGCRTAARARLRRCGAPRFRSATSNARGP